jgi:hypothetical protein
MMFMRCGIDILSIMAMHKAERMHEADAAPQSWGEKDRKNATDDIGIDQ